jgi:MFS superfamily sulfate permease-like transporter
VGAVALEAVAYAQIAGLPPSAGLVPERLGIPGASGNFFPKLWGVLTDLGDTSGWTLATGAVSIGLLLVLARTAPKTMKEHVVDLARNGVELRLAAVRAPALALLERADLAGRIPILPTLDAAVPGPSR